MGALTTHRRRVEVNGKTAVVVDMGRSTAPRCALIVASMLVRDKSYRPLLHALVRAGWRAIVVEMPGSGYASPVRFPWTMADYAEWLGDFIAKLELPVKPILIGHSNSGPPVIITCASRSELLRGLVLVDVTGADTRFSVWPLLVGRAIDAAIEWKLTLTGFHHVAFNLLFHFRNAFNQIRLAGQVDIRDDARAIKCPTLIAWGARDHTCPARCFELLKSLLPQSRQHVARDGSHDWLITHAGAFVQVLDGVDFCA